MNFLRFPVIKYHLGVFFVQNFRYGPIPMTEVPLNRNQTMGHNSVAVWPFVYACVGRSPPRCEKRNDHTPFAQGGCGSSIPRPSRSLGPAAKQVLQSRRRFPKRSTDFESSGPPAVDGRPAPTMTSRSGCILGNNSVISQEAHWFPPLAAHAPFLREFCTAAQHSPLFWWADSPDRKDASGGKLAAKHALHSGREDIDCERLR